MKLIFFRVRGIIVAVEITIIYLGMCLFPYLPSMKCACAIFSFVAYLFLQFFFTWSRKRHDFRKKKNMVKHWMCVLIFFTILSEIFPIIRRIAWGMINMYIGLHVKYPSCPNSVRISILRDVPTIPDQAPNTKYYVPMSLWVVEKNHRVKISWMAGINK
jgi:hypothetical protein